MNPYMYAVMRVAHELGKFVHEVVDMNPQEFALWVEYLKQLDKSRRMRTRTQ